MYKKLRNLLYLIPGLLLVQMPSFGQSSDSVLSNSRPVSSRFLAKIASKTATADETLGRQTTKYLDRFSRLDARLMAKLQKTDTNAAKHLPPVDYQQWVCRMQDTASLAYKEKTYIARLDTLQTTLKFLQSNQANAGSLNTSSGPLAKVTNQVQQLQAHLDESALISQYVTERRQQITQYLSQFSSLPPGVLQSFNQYKATAYYYRQQVEQFKNSLNDPQKIEQQTINQLNKLPAYQQFLAKHSMLASLFQIPTGDDASASLQGLQTKDQVQQLLQQQVSAGGSGGQAAVDQQMQQAKSQLTSMQSNLSKYGIGGQELDMPNFQPNQQKTRTFLKRLTYGASLQLSKSTDYFPATAYAGLTIGYKINDKSTVGIGASYNIGLGSDWGHMQFSSQGMGLRSFMDWKIKKTYYVTGGYELNYMTQFNSIAQLKDRSLWQPSALIGLEKKYKISSKLQGSLQVLFDALYRQELPAGQMIKFRVGYNF